MEEALISYLLADAGLKALVDNRINWDERVQAEALPAIVLQKVSGSRDYTTTGPSGLVESRVQIDVWAADRKAGSATASGFTQALRIARLVEARLSGLRQTIGAAAFQGVFLEAERQSSEDATGGKRVDRISIDFLIHHRKA